MPVWSPGGGTIAFMCQTLPHYVNSIYVADVDSGKQRRLTSGGFPSWSPNGSRIAFDVLAGGIFTVRCDGSGRTRVVGGSYAELPLWSPDGRSILYKAPSPKQPMPGGGLFVVSATGGKGRLIATLTAQNVRPAWSPDSTKVAFEVAQRTAVLPTGLQIAVVNRDGAHLEALTSGDGDRYAPAWSPDGREIAFGLSTGYARGSRPQIQIVSSDGTRLRVVASGSAPTFSPDGTRIAFARDSGIWVARVDGSGLLRVAASSPKVVAFNQVWSPDGRTLAFVRQGAAASSTAKIWLVNGDGTHLRPLDRH